AWARDEDRGPERWGTAAQDPSSFPATRRRHQTPRTPRQSRHRSSGQDGNGNALLSLAPRPDESAVPALAVADILEAAGGRPTGGTRPEAQVMASIWSCRN